jgi:hypothetical protein
MTAGATYSKDYRGGNINLLAGQGVNSYGGNITLSGGTLFEYLAKKWLIIYSDIWLIKSG